MLKINPKIDINNVKLFEKYGFRPKYSETTGEITEYYRISGDRKGATITLEENWSAKRKWKNFWHIETFTRRISDHGYIELTTDDYEILYDLIKDGIVVKQ